MKSSWYGTTTYACRYFIILKFSTTQFLTVYFNAAEIFLLEPKGREGEELGHLLLYNPLWSRYFPPTTNLRAFFLTMAKWRPTPQSPAHKFSFGWSIPGGPLLERGMEQDGVPLHLHYAGGAHLWNKHIKLHLECRLSLAIPSKIKNYNMEIHCQKRLQIYSRPGRVWLVTSRLGTWKNR